MKTSLISIRPQFAQCIFALNKTVELRRSRMCAGPGHVLVIYEAAPVMAVTGIAKVRAVEAGSVTGMWRSVGAASALKKDDYDRYFRGTDRAFAIHLFGPVRLAKPIALRDLRKHAPGFAPPQSWRGFDSLPDNLASFLRAAVFGTCGEPEASRPDKQRRAMVLGRR